MTPDHCPTCEVELYENICPTCQWSPMDQLIQRASTPNLASLFRAGRKAGLIATTQAYV